MAESEEKQLTAAQMLDNLADALAEDILSMSDEEFLAECVEDGDDPAELAAECERAAERAVAEFDRRRAILSHKD